MKYPLRPILLFALFCVFISLLSCSSEIEKRKLIIFHAGSLSVPFKLMKEEYEKANPEVNIVLEAAGSVASVRKITELNREADIMASADYRIINQMLIPEFAGWNISFAANEMVLACRDDSPVASMISQDNWMDVLLQEETHYGRSNPDHDPCGYRTLVTLKLAEAYYQRPGMAERILQKDKRFIRPKETDLLALLESGTIEAIFIYRSVAEQHGLSYITLPDSINLKQRELADWYATATVFIAGKVPGERILLNGAPMVYGITMLHAAPNRQEGLRFLAWFFHEEGGRKILEQQRQPSLIPAVSKTYINIPKTLQPYARP
ncbi:MAG: substrate-binding domain-containing protein [Bacteroidales bacterium]